MLRPAKYLHGAILHATDGPIGHVEEILFDDASWVIRYLTVNTGGSLFGRKVLIAPIAFGALDGDKRVLNVSLTREQVDKSPGLETNEPVSRRFEVDFYDYYGWPYYWVGTNLHGAAGLYRGMGSYDGMGPYGALGAAAEGENTPVLNYQDAGSSDRIREDRAAPDESSAHLRSANEIRSYAIVATDGHLGHVADFVFDDANWKIRYVAVDTHNWWPGSQALLALDCIRSLNWPERTISVDLNRDALRNAPRWDPQAAISVALEAEMAGYYRRLAQPR